MRLADGRWKSINTSVFAGWYTLKFCEYVISAFEEEFRLEEEAEARRETLARHRKTTGSKHVTLPVDVPRSGALPAVRKSATVKTVPAIVSTLPKGFLNKTWGIKNKECRWCSKEYRSKEGLRKHEYGCAANPANQQDKEQQERLALD